MTPSASPRLQALDFVDDIERLTQDFVGRDWIFRELDEWVSRGDGTFFLLTGAAGIGKSAVAARLTQIRSDIAAYHLCIAGRNSTIVPGTVIRSIAAQLGKNLPGYGEALANTIKPTHLSINVRIQVGRLEGGAITGVVLENLAATDPKLEAELLLTAPLSAMPTPAHRALIVVDSLDEAFTYGSLENFVTLLSGLNNLPGWVRIVLTSRPDDRVLSYFGSVHRCDVAADSPSNREDLLRYVRRRVEKPALRARLAAARNAIEPDTFTNRLVGRGDGNSLGEGSFLYTKILLDDLESGAQALDDPAALPGSLDEIYHRFLVRLAPEWESKYQPLLAALAVARDPLSRKQLTAFADQSAQLIGKRLSGTMAHLSIGVLRQFLHVSGAPDDEQFRLFHRSFCDFLGQAGRSHRFFCPPEDGHRAIADSYLAKYNADWSACDSYGICHVPVHLLKSQRLDEFATLIANQSYLRGLALYKGRQLGYWSSADICRLFRSILQECPAEAIQSSRRLANIAGRPLDRRGHESDDLDAGLSNYQERNLFSFSCCINYDFFLGLGRPSARAACKCCGQANVRYGVYDFSGADYYEHFFVWCANCFWSSSEYSHSDDVNYTPYRFSEELCMWTG